MKILKWKEERIVTNLGLNLLIGERGLQVQFTIGSLFQKETIILDIENGSTFLNFGQSGLQGVTKENLERASEVLLGEFDSDENLGGNIGGGGSGSGTREWSVSEGIDTGNGGMAKLFTGSRSQRSQKASSASATNDPRGRQMRGLRASATHIVEGDFGIQFVDAHRDSLPPLSGPLGRVEVFGSGNG